MRSPIDHKCSMIIGWETEVGGGWYRKNPLDRFYGLIGSVPFSCLSEVFFGFSLYYNKNNKLLLLCHSLTGPDIKFIHPIDFDEKVSICVSLVCHIIGK